MIRNLLDFLLQTELIINSSQSLPQYPDLADQIDHPSESSARYLPL